MAEIVGRSAQYIFPGYGGYGDKLQEQILREFKSFEYPLPVQIQEVHSGSGLMGLVFGSNEQCAVIYLEDNTRIIVSHNSVGTCLYVAVYLMIPAHGRGLGATIAEAIGDVFKLQRYDAFYYTAVTAVESAFDSLAFQQVNYGYRKSSEL